MNLKPHDNREDMKVWLSENEVDLLLEKAADTEQRIAFALGARCGLRSHEVLDVAPAHVHETDAGTMLRVHHGKGDKFRETPVPDELATQIRTIDDVRDESSDTPLVSVRTTQSLRNWIQNARAAARDDAEDSGWNHLSSTIYAERGQRRSLHRMLTRW